MSYELLRPHLTVGDKFEYIWDNYNDANLGYNLEQYTKGCYYVIEEVRNHAVVMSSDHDHDFLFTHSFITHFDISVIPYVELLLLSQGDYIDYIKYRNLGDDVVNFIRDKRKLEEL